MTYQSGPLAKLTVQIQAEAIRPHPGQAWRTWHEQTRTNALTFRYVPPQPFLPATVTVTFFNGTEKTFNADTGELVIELTK